MSHLYISIHVISTIWAHVYYELELARFSVGLII